MASFVRGGSDIIDGAGALASEAATCTGGGRRSSVIAKLYLPLDDTAGADFAKKSLAARVMISTQVSSEIAVLSSTMW